MNPKYNEIIATMDRIIDTLTEINTDLEFIQFGLIMIYALIFIILTVKYRGKK